VKPKGCLGRQAIRRKDARCGANEAFDRDKRPRERKASGCESNANERRTHEEVSGEVDERSIASLDLAIETGPVSCAYASSDLDFGREERGCEERIRDVGGDVGKNRVKPKLQTHEEDEQQMQTEDGLRANEKTDRNGQAKACWGQVFAFEVTEGAFAFLAPKRKRRQGRS
jgi:hypothetical protein